eukprot:40532-Pelagomonas_calceolata.AAC.2
MFSGNDRQHSQCMGAYRQWLATQPVHGCLQAVAGNTASAWVLAGKGRQDVSRQRQAGQPERGCVGGMLF